MLWDDHHSGYFSKENVFLEQCITRETPATVDIVIIKCREKGTAPNGSNTNSWESRGSWAIRPAKEEKKIYKGIICTN
jgi:hypothetical protein